MRQPLGAETVNKGVLLMPSKYGFEGPEVEARKQQEQKAKEQALRHDLFSNAERIDAVVRDICTDFLTTKGYNVKDVLLNEEYDDKTLSKEVPRYLPDPVWILYVERTQYARELGSIERILSIYLKRRYEHEIYFYVMGDAEEVKGIRELAKVLYRETELRVEFQGRRASETWAYPQKP
jgi:hypothetical protein